MSTPNITGKKLKANKKIELNVLNTISNNYLSSRDLLTRTNPNRKKNNELSKVILKGKLFGLINKSNIMTDEQFNDIKIKLSLSQLEKYKVNKKKINENFYYAQRNPNILTFSKNSNKFEDDYINMRDLLHKKFTLDEQRTILSFPQFFQLNSNEFLKELVEEKHKNLFEIIGNEEKKELENLRLKRQKRFSNINYNYSNSPKRKSIILNKDENYNLNNKKKINVKVNFNNKHISRNEYFQDTIFKNNYSTNKNKSVSNIASEEMKTFNTRGNYYLPLIKDENKHNSYFHDDVGKKYKLLRKDIEKKINTKFENMKKRKELVILNNRKKLDLIKEKNRMEQSKKEQERLKIYHEKKYIEYIVAKLKKNYIQVNKENENEENKLDNKNENNNSNNNSNSLSHNNSNNNIINNNSIINNISNIKIDKSENKIKSSLFH